MLIQIAVGSLLIVWTVVLASILIAFGADILSHYLAHALRQNERLRLTVTLTLVTIWLVVVFTVVMWLWAVAFLAIGVFSGIEESLYFSMVSLTTLGFGDVILPKEWRLLSGFIATSGFILFGLGTAFILETLKEEAEEIQEQDKSRERPFKRH